MADDKKSFTGSAQAFFSSGTLEVEPAEQKKQKKEKTEPLTVIPEGYKLVPEAKNKRVQLLLKPTAHAKLKAIADVKKVSFNELVNNILDEYIERSNK